MTFLFLWGNVVKQKTDRKERKVFLNAFVAPKLHEPSDACFQLPESCKGLKRMLLQQHVSIAGIFWTATHDSGR
jgi:hypothetical protein